MYSIHKNVQDLRALEFFMFPGLSALIPLGLVCSVNVSGDNLQNIQYIILDSRYLDVYEGISRQDLKVLNGTIDDKALNALSITFPVIFLALFFIYISGAKKLSGKDSRPGFLTIAFHRVTEVFCSVIPTVENRAE